MGRTTALRREIKKTFLPYVAKKGFTCDMRDAPGFFTFRKLAADAVYVFDIQWEKYGRPRFVVNFGKCGPNGVIVRDERILPKDLNPYHAVTHGRLSPGRQGFLRSGWFRQDRPLIGRMLSFSKLREPADVIAELMLMFVEVEEYWTDGKIGKHIRIFPPWPPAVRPREINSS